MTISREGLEFIAHFEGFRAARYLDPHDGWTIGYGHLIQPADRITEPMTHPAALELLAVDADAAAQFVIRLVTVPLMQCELDALTSFVFNLGTTAFRRSTLRKCLNRGDAAAAAAQFNRWVYDDGVRVPGLIKRRKAETKLFRAGIYDPLDPTTT